MGVEFEGKVTVLHFLVCLVPPIDPIIGFLDRPQHQSISRLTMVDKWSDFISC